MALETPDAVGGESHGSIAWSLMSHFHVPMLAWVHWAILLTTVIALIAAVAALIAPHRFGRPGWVLSCALAALGPMFGILGTAMTMLQVSIYMIDSEATAACAGVSPVAVGVAASVLVFGLLAGVLGVFLATLLRLISRSERGLRA